MEKKVILIMGMSDGLTLEQLVKKLTTKKEELEKQNYDVITPLEVLCEANIGRLQMNLPSLNIRENRGVVLGMLIFQLACCEELHLLPCWQESRDAELLRHFALSVNIPIVYH